MDLEYRRNTNVSWRQPHILCFYVNNSIMCSFIHCPETGFCIRSLNIFVFQGMVLFWVRTPYRNPKDGHHLHINRPENPKTCIFIVTSLFAYFPQSFLSTGSLIVAWLPSKLTAVVVLMLFDSTQPEPLYFVHIFIVCLTALFVPQTKHRMVE